jgi:hypothetical protein
MNIKREGDVRMKVKAIIVSIALSTMLFGCGGGTPSKEQVSEALKPILPPNFTVNSVEKLSALENVFEVVVLIDKQPTVLYVDGKLKHVISGSIVEIASKKNLTYETQMKNKPASPAQPAAAASQQPTPPQQKAK